MNHIKFFSAVALMMFGLTTASAQTNDESQKLTTSRKDWTLTYPQLFFGVQGGGQTTLTQYNNWKLITPTASFSFGSFFTPVVGARLHFNGIWNKGGYYDDTEDFKYRYKYLTTNLDLMVNLVTLLGKKNYYPLNVYLIGGLGMNYAWDNGEAFARSDKMPLAYDGCRFGHNARIGAQLDCNLSKHVSVNLEFSANNLRDIYNSRMSGKGDWQLTAQLGVAYKFAAKRKAPSNSPIMGEKQEAILSKSDSEAGEVWETRQDTIWYDEVVETPKVVKSSKTWAVFYGVGKTDFAADEQLAEIRAFLKDWHDCKVYVKSYADAKTGKAEKNMEVSRLRREKAVKALTDAGVPASSITSNHYGDTIQPFAENGKNRVTIIVATGQNDSKEKKTSRKFKTKEVRYRVR